MSIRKSFRSVQVNSCVETPAKRAKTEKWSWEKCFICQEKTAEPLRDPRNVTRVLGNGGLENLAKNLLRFHSLGELDPSLDFVAVTECGANLEELLTTNNAKYHHSCSQQFNNTKLKRAEKRVELKEKENVSPVTPGHATRASLLSSYHGETCMFCDQPSTRSDPLFTVMTDEGAKQIIDAAAILGESKILVLAASRPLKGYAKYHRKHRTNFMNRLRAHSAGERPDLSQAHGLALAKIIYYIKEQRLTSEQPPVWKMADLTRFYVTEMAAMGLECSGHSTRLRERLLAECPELDSSGTNGQDILIAFKKDFDDSIRKDCRRNFDEEGSYLTRTAEIVRADLFGEDCSLLPLRSLVEMLMYGGRSSERDEEHYVDTVVDLLAYHATKHRGKGKHRRHSIQRETPTPVYVASKIYGETRMKELVDITFQLGLSISYNRLDTILKEKGAVSAAVYRRDGLVCPESLRRNVFTTFSVDNLDHDTSSATAKTAFHGTAICAAQHPRPGATGELRAPLPVEPLDGNTALSKRFELPGNYGTVPVSFLNPKKSKPPVCGLRSEDFGNWSLLNGAKKWLDLCLTDNSSRTWPDFHSKEDLNRPKESEYKSRVTLFPLFPDVSHSVSMMAHSMGIAASTTHFLNPGQTPVLVADQPLYALMKTIQWQDNLYAEDKFFVMLGGLHIEMAALKVIGQWFNESGWVNMLVEAGITTQGRAESMIHASHVTRTRYAHEVTAAALYRLMHDEFEAFTCDDPLSFEEWREQRRRSSVMFRFWDIGFNLVLTVLELVRALRTANFSLFKVALQRLAPWLFALDHVNYARWLPVHIRDLCNLEVTHPALYKEFKDGKFVARLTVREFSAIALDQAHEQQNARLKGDGGIIGLVTDPASLRKWELTAPHLAEMNANFEERMAANTSFGEKHHRATSTARNTFRTEVSNLVAVMKDAGNPFADEGQDLYNIHTKVISSSKVTSTVFEVEELGTSLYLSFIKDRLESGTVSVHDPIRQNKLPLFSTRTVAEPKHKSQLKSVKKTCGLFGSLLASTDSEQPVDLNHFFMHEIEEFPPSISVHGRFKSCNKADVFRCAMEGITTDWSSGGPPEVDAKILDGAAIIHILGPGSSLTFADYAQSFVSFMKREAGSVKRLDIVWDKYLKESLKSMTREKRGQGVRRRVVLTSKIPTKGWQSFMRDPENKTELFLLLAESLKDVVVEGRVICSTYGEGVIISPPSQDLSGVAPCNHEEADTRLFIHVAEASRRGHRRIMIRTSDSDIVAIGVSCRDKLAEIDELWVHLKAGRQDNYLPVHEIVRALGPSKSLALIGFHAFTGCDTVSSFHGYGKNKPWATLKSYPEAVDTFIALSRGDVDEALPTLTKFVIAMYSPAKMYSSLALCRRALHTKHDRSVENLPPTDDALLQHTKRASLQAQVWRQALQLQQCLPSPADWGWRKEDSVWLPQWLTTPVAADACEVLIRCGCKTVCRGNCKCSRNKKPCSKRCTCICESAQLH